MMPFPYILKGICINPYQFFRVFSAAAKGNYDKANVIKKLNYENKALYGAVISPKTKKKVPVAKQTKTKAPGESEYSSEIYWQTRSDTRINVQKKPSYDCTNTRKESLLIPFTAKELKSVTMFPIIPTSSGIFENNWVLHEQHESDEYKSPSVNRVLSATMPEASRQNLLRWKASKIAELGEEGFQQLQKSILNRGSALHTSLETWLSGSYPSDEMLEKTGNLWQSIRGALEHVERPAKIVERKLYHPYLHYNGVVDCITGIKGQHHVIEWKTSDNPKATVAATYDAPIQVCAYLGALQANDELRDVELQKGAIFVAYTNGKPANVHILTDSEMRRYWQLWLQRLKEYWIRYRDGTLPDPI